MRRFALFFLLLVASFSLLAGCTEFDQRGGILAYAGDKLFFPAPGKGHRVLRAYVIAGALTSIARSKGVAGPDQSAFYGKLMSVMEVMREAFTCAYQGHSGCIFFDEKMARLNYALFKYAVDVLIDDQDKKLGTQVRDAIIGRIPFLSSVADAATKTVGLIGDAATATKQTTDIVQSLMQLGYDLAVTGGRIAPLYRDAVEMEMRVLVDWLARKCSNDLKLQKRRDYFNLHDYLENPKHSDDDKFCKDFQEADAAYNSGNGKLQKWKDYIDNDPVAVEYREEVTPTADQFIAVSNLIVSACDDINEKYPCKSIVLFGKEVGSRDAYKRASDKALKLSFGDPQWTATCDDKAPKSDCKMTASARNAKAKQKK